MKRIIMVLSLVALSIVIKPAETKAAWPCPPSLGECIHLAAQFWFGGGYCNAALYWAGLGYNPTVAWDKYLLTKEQLKELGVTDVISEWTQLPWEQEAQDSVD